MTAALMPIAVALVAFGVMELVSYASHRWLMHGPGIGWHRSHHRPPHAPLERNDLFPLCFSVVGFGLFAAGAWWPGYAVFTWVAVGVTAYGACYLLVHEVVIHRRLALSLPLGPYGRWLRDRHRLHHLDGGEPYGMLLPLVSQRRSAALDPESSRSVDLLDRSTREIRSLL
jgi:beta-carotene 3-hydroxylase